MRGGAREGEWARPADEALAVAVVHDSVAPAVAAFSRFEARPWPSELARRAASALKVAEEDCFGGVRTERTRLGKVGEAGRRGSVDLRRFLELKKDKRETIVVCPERGMGKGGRWSEVKERVYVAKLSGTESAGRVGV